MFLLQAVSGYAKVFEVGSNSSYPTPNALYLANVLRNRDTIYIDRSEYRGIDALAVWNADSLLIRGINGRPHLIADGQYIHQKGIWVIKGNNCTVENIEFSGAKVPDKNGAGIRLDGTGINIRHCYFHDCEDGILTSNPNAGDILIEHSEFAHCGYGNGYSHNLYVGRVQSLTFRYNHTHHCKVGHCLKSRAKNNYIYYNFFSDETDGYSSRLLDLPNGGFTIVMGNIFVQGPQAINGNAFGYGLEGLENVPPHSLYIVNNTFVNERHSARFISVKEGTSTVHIQNNIFAGTGIILEGNQTTLLNNFIKTNIDETGFKDHSSFDYRLTAGSEAINLGGKLDSVNGFALQPEFQYQKHLQYIERNIVEQIDAGAFEYGLPLFSKTPYEQSFKLGPNPASDRILITGAQQGSLIQVFGITGKKFIETEAIKQNVQLQISQLPKGIYIAKVGKSSKRFIKK